VTGGYSRTARDLRRFRWWLLALAVLVLAGATSAVVIVRETAAAASRYTVPAIIASSSAGYALAKADSDAMRGFGLGAVSITGPGSDYEAQISLAEQNLEQVAELNQVPAGTQQLLLIDSQMASYRQLVEQAHADYTAGSAELGFVEVAYASRLMHSQVLTELTQLTDLEQAALADQTSEFSMSGWAVPTWALPVLALLAALIVAQRYLSARFRRSINGGIAGATALLLLLALGTSTVFLTESRLTAARHWTDRLVADRSVTFAEVSTAGQNSPMLARLNGLCEPDVRDSDHGGCGTATSAAPATAQVDAAAAANDRADAAAGGAYLEYVVPLLGLAIGALVWTGLWLRIKEYRRRKT
jgi:hypothetical protein